MRPILLAVPVLVALFASSAAAEVRLPARGERFVYDPSGTIAADDAAVIEKTNHDLFARTGTPVTVVVFPTLEGAGLEDLLAQSSTDWGLGTGKDDRGFALAMAIAERRVLIATGGGVETLLSPDELHSIIQKFVIPRLARNDLSHAMAQGNSALVAAVGPKLGAVVATPTATTGSGRRPVRGLLPSLTVVAFVAGLALRPLVRRLLARVSPMRWIAGLLIIVAFINCESPQWAWRLDSTYSNMLLGSHEFYERATGKDAGTTVDWLQIYVTRGGRSYERTLDSVTSQTLIFESDDSQLIARLLTAARAEVNGHLCEPPSNGEVLHILFYDRDLLRVGYFVYLACKDGQRGGVMEYGTNALLVSTELPKFLMALQARDFKQLRGQ